ncbi:molybdate transport repressor ModE-like protein [Azospirillum brasilense]|uniref:Molybdate transport repressor ModE-like protein n=1 Tax=Azospirillum brasilense TaxID=192 RepID=A0A560CE65_AZOBR|nr:LysR family transcriptional regulator [Azospirillum brasilense]TWA83139.1 molybdate transport repressor ModE-like protein [Azospirillum brasilense]
MTVHKQTASLNWDDLRIFLELARTGSLSAAARALRISHATVGRRVAALEEGLGRRLVERRADGYGLTTDGEAVFALADGMDERALAILRQASSQGGHEAGLTGTVRLTTTPALADRFLMPRLGPFRARHPEIDLEVMVDNRSLSLARREADIAIRLARPQHGDLIARRLATMGYGLFTAAGAPDAVIGYDEALADLPEAVWLARHMVGRRVAFRSNSLQTQLAAAKAGFGVALLPFWLAAGEPDLMPVPGEAPPLEREVWLVLHPDLRDVPRVRAVIEHLVVLFTAEFAAAPDRQNCQFAGTQA